MQITDSSILALLRKPDQQEKGFRLLMKKYGDSLYWHIRRIVVSHDDAEDVLQETAINIYKNISQFKGDETQLKVWLYRIATNESLTLLRSHTRLFQSIDDLNPSLLNTMMTENRVNMEEVEYHLQQKLLTLPTQQRIVFNMRYYDDLSYEEIAKVTGKKVGTLKANYHFARTKIEEELKNIAL